MKKFMLLHFGFEKPTPEIMEAWGNKNDCRKESVHCEHPGV